jgi:hypothetical protein
VDAERLDDGAEGRFGHTSMVQRTAPRENGACNALRGSRLAVATRWRL